MRENSFPRKFLLIRIARHSDTPSYYGTHSPCVDATSHDCLLPVQSDSNLQLLPPSPLYPRGDKLTQPMALSIQLTMLCAATLNFLIFRIVWAMHE